MCGHPAWSALSVFALTSGPFSVVYILATLILPRAPDRRRACRRFVVRFNKEAGRFNNLLRRHCFRKGKLFFLDHGLEWLPPGRVLAADGIHPSFEGVALIASHLRSVLPRNAAKSVSGWLDHAPRSSSSAPTEDLPYHEEFPTIREGNESRHRQSARQLPTRTERGQRRNSPSTTPRDYAEAAGGAASGSDD
ncbi:hypothetical protein HPB50_003309 [Hyalomma asiaticum]|uniref:Uncharacterized protein n=1 Tax=Hyalomma asiaticum TaxID=266040 RepID=A0ACB7SBT3_HYAAI|nr:hypothetical protein HPB50_003309 [Hyalomma asiaticum]